MSTHGPAPPSTEEGHAKIHAGHDVVDHRGIAALHLREVCAWLHRSPALWRTYLHEHRAPPPAATPYGQPHWTRGQLEHWRTHRPGRGWWGPHHQHSATQRALQAIQQAAAGEHPTTAELAHRAGVSRTTTHHTRQTHHTHPPTGHAH